MRVRLPISNGRSPSGRKSSDSKYSRASATVEIPATKNGTVTAYLYGTSSKRGVKQTLTVTDLPATGTDTSLPALLGALLVVSGMLIVTRRRIVG
ncbi:MAG: LPXTG cell wall anchor domain-containing protein [Actinobacteria bacterium]|nr:LPXTG cell wall anchor domain-containing protein [Actinomycetota bacterium]